jgi:hypothetical protein
VQEALGQLKILLLLFIFGQENLNSIYPHETAKSHFNSFSGSWGYLGNGVGGGMLQGEKVAA